MASWTRLGCWILACYWGVSAARLSAQEVTSAKAESDQATSTQAPKFLRYVEKAGRPQALEVAVVHYETASSEGVQVDLVGAVHIGERQYYAALNELFDKYDVVLYELVAPEGTVIPKGGRTEGPQHPVAMLQDGARSLLGLESQLASVDYTKQHFIRADMTPEQMGQKMAERGDTPLTVALSTLADVLRQQNLKANKAEVQSLVEDDFDLTTLVSEPVKLKQMLAKQLASSGSLDEALGQTLNQLLVKDRNAAAMRVLQQQIAAGKKRIAIFYGAAHLNDFHQRLVADLDMQAKSTQWLVAWDLTRGGKSPLEEPMQILQQLIQSLE